MSAIHRFFASERAHKKRARVALFMMFAIAATIFAASSSRAASSVAALSARTGDTGNGQLDTITVTFGGLMKTSSTPLIATAEGQPGIWVGDGYEIASVGWGELATTLTINLVEKSDPDTAAKPPVKYTPGGDTSAGLESADGQELTAFTLTGTQVIDGAGPALVKVTAKDVGIANMFNAAMQLDSTKNEQVNFNFSEPVTLSGGTAQDKWFALERAMTFTKGSGTLNCVDGTWPASGTSFNFPQPPAAATAAQDPISITGNVINVTAKNGDVMPSGSNQFRAVPVTDFWCKVGVDTQNNGLIRDLANNSAATLNMPAAGAGLNLVHPVDIALLSANTVDSAPADGKVDAIELVYDQNLNDATIQAQLPQITISEAGVDAIVDTTTLDTGSVTDDPRFLVRFTLPAGIVWDGGIKPTVAYAKPVGCTGTGGTGIKGKVPSWTLAAPWEACAGSFTQVSIDRITPLIKSAKTLDVDGDGLLDRIEATFSEPMVTGGAAGWKVDTRQATAFAVDADNKKALIDFPEGSAGDTGTLPSIQYTAQGTSSAAAVVDFGQNEIASQTRNANIDGAAPRIRTATVLGTSQGKVNKAELVYSENIVDPAGTAASSFTIGESTSTGIVTGAANDNILTINVDPIDGTDRKAVAYSGSGAPIRDAANNVTGAQSFAAADVIDGAKPVGTVTISQGAPMSAGVKTVVVTFSEPMATAAAPQVVLHAATDKNVDAIQSPGHEATGWLTENTTTWEGSVTVVGGPEGDCLVSTGCQVSVTADGATDASPAAQPQLSTAILNTEIDTIAPLAPVPGTFATTIASGESVPANTVNMFTSSFSLGGTFVAGDAAGGTLELLVDTNPLDPPAQSPVIGATSTSTTAVTSFADSAALQTAITEGARTLTLELCDDAQNCTPSSTTLEITADYTPVDVSLTAPAGDNVVAGGATLPITWNGDEADAGFSRTILEYSANNGSTYSVIEGTQPLDGSFDWTVPTIDAAEAKVRAASVDVNGNKAYGTSAAFSIDSTAPVVSITKPTTSFPFVPAGAPTQVRWNATDASIARATNPITIEYSVNGGSTWAEINGGDYSQANDGEEDWNVPSGASFLVKLRVTASDATNKATTVLSSKLAKGVDGYVADKGGSVVAFGTANGTTNETALPSGYSVRGLALRSSGTAGYVVSHNGLLYPFSIGDTPKPAKPSATKFSADKARGIALRTDTSGYVLDMYGRLWAFGGAPKATVSKVFTSDDARSVVMLPNGRGGYVLDKYGRLYRFRVGSYSWPASITATQLSSARAVGFVLRSNLRSGWVLDSYGRLYPFGGAPSRTSYGVSSTAYAKALVLVAQDSGYWVDGRGRLKPFGSAFGNPTRTTLGTNRARGAVS